MLVAQLGLKLVMRVSLAGQGDAVSRSHLHHHARHHHLSNTF
jgi:hypothetical protein